MLGCLKSVFKLAIIVLAVIGFVKIGGVDFSKKVYKHFQEFRAGHEKPESTQYIRDIVAKDDQYSLLKDMTFMGYDVVLAEHTKSGQKLAVLESDKVHLLTSDDFVQGKINAKLDSLTKKIGAQHVRFKNFKLIDDGKIFKFQNSNYVKFEAGVEGLPFDKIKGAVGVYKTKDGKEKIYISANTADQYSQDISDEYFKKVFQ